MANAPIQGGRQNDCQETIHARNARGGTAGLDGGARAGFGRRRQDRRAHRHERTGLDADRPGVGGGGGGGGGGFRGQGGGQGDQRDRRRPSAQGGYRRQHRAALV